MSIDNPNGKWDTKNKARDEFESGAVRDTQNGKTRYDLIPVAPLTRLANRFELGADEYGENNYQKGMPYRRVFASLLRHAYQWATGDKSEDHLAAVAWNAFALMFYEDAIIEGDLPASLNNLHKPSRKFYDAMKAVAKIPINAQYINVEYGQAREDAIYEFYRQHNIDITKPMTHAQRILLHNHLARLGFFDDKPRE